MAATSSSHLNGVIAINKPLGITSAQVIRDCQEIFGKSALFKPLLDQQTELGRKRPGKLKIGHGGTLDPLATGVLILGIGEGTKSLSSFLGCTKSYETVVLFGASTDTYDRVGKVLAKKCYDDVAKPKVLEALKHFRGNVKQVPPMYSAIKMNGMPLYDYARQGLPLPREIETKEVEVPEINLLEWYAPGSHNHRWPLEEATPFEQNFAQQFSDIGKQQVQAEQLSPREKAEDSKARQELSTGLQEADKRIDALVFPAELNLCDKRSRRAPRTERPKRNQRNHRNQRNRSMVSGDHEFVMSGALGEAPPEKSTPSFVPPPHDPNSPPPWQDKGPPAARIQMTVSSGFYVRSFCHDLGIKVGSAALMAELCRGRQGDFVLHSSNCLEYADLLKGEDVWAPKVQSALDRWNSKSSAEHRSDQRAEESVEPSRTKRKASEGPDDEKLPQSSVVSSPVKRRKASKDSADDWNSKSPKEFQCDQKSVEPSRIKRQASEGPNGDAPSLSAIVPSPAKKGKASEDSDDQWKSKSPAELQPDEKSIESARTRRKASESPDDAELPQASVVPSPAKKRKVSGEADDSGVSRETKLRSLSPVTLDYAKKTATEGDKDAAKPATQQPPTAANAAVQNGDPIAVSSPQSEEWNGFDDSPSATQ